MAIWDYKLHNGIYSGVDDAKIKDLIRGGVLTRDSEIAVSGTDKWRAIGVTKFRSDCERAEESTRDVTSSVASPARIGPTRLGRFYQLWVIVQIVWLLYNWHVAESYNPGGNGMFSVAEASILGAQWAQLTAYACGGIVISLAFGVGILAARADMIAAIDRAGHQATVDELRAIRATLERLEARGGKATSDE